ncbi:MAG: hypothetical protein JWP87_5803 [Labilithrix sp.]|nr:hypothetical protein [Labilithrix sp.]
MRKFVFFFGFSGLVSAAALAAVACGDSSPNDGRVDLPGRDEDGASKETGTSNPGVDSATPAASCKDITFKVGEPASCDQCAKAKCCEEVLTCVNTPDCTRLQECIAPCDQSDFVCIGTCQDMHPKGNASLIDVGSCVQSNCKTECPSQTPDGGNDFNDF